MGCFGNDHEKNERLAAEHKWDYITLSDFRSNSCWTPFTYVVLYITLLISIACYVIDIFTCSQLLLFDRWSGQIQPVVPLNISRWVFTGCILLSLVLLVYRWIRAVRAIRSGGVANSYLDPLAVRLQSIRMGETGRGWRRFLVFAELTKSKKGAEYVALFAYFSFEASLRIVLAEGPRQAINAMTLASVMQTQFIPDGQHSAPVGSSPIAQFFINVKIFAQGDQLRAVVLFGMLFTLIIWIIAAIGLVIACILYIVFLWHHIPSTDGGLSGFCKRKIDGRLQKIVDVKIKKALEKEEKKRLKQEAKSLKGGESTTSFKRQPTLPVLADVGDDKLPAMPMLTRQDTQATFSTQASTVLGSERQPTVPNIGGSFPRPFPSRSATQASGRSDASNAPLVASAAPMGYEQGGNPYSPTEISPISPFSGSNPSLSRSLTGQTQISQNSYNYGQGLKPLPSRQDTFGSQYSATTRPSPGPYGPPVRQNTSTSNGSFSRPIQSMAQRQNTNDTTRSAGDYFGTNHRNPSSSSRPPTSQSNQRPAPQDFELQARTLPDAGLAQGKPKPYVAYKPGMPSQTRGPNPAPPIRNFSFQNQPQPQGGRPQHIPRSGTAPPMADPYDDSIYDSYQNDDPAFSRPAMPTRAATAGPNFQQWRS